VSKSTKAHDARPEIDESTWVYLGAHHARNRVRADRPFAEMLAEACERAGFAVFARATDPGPRLWVEALRHAELCVIDVGARSALSGAELAMAYCSGRPLLALRLHGEQPPTALAGIIQSHPAAREIVFEDAADCLTKLHRALTDPAWQQLVRDAAITEEL
jgi:hypothetical protein